MNPIRTKCDKLILNIIRDVTAFGTRGVNEDTLDALQALIDVFADLPTDKEMKGTEQQKLKTPYGIYILTVRGLPRE